MNVRENERDTNIRTIHGKKTIKKILKVKQDGLHQKLEGETSSRTLMATTPKMNARENLTIQRHTQHCAQDTRHKTSKKNHNKKRNVEQHKLHQKLEGEPRCSRTVSTSFFLQDTRLVKIY